MARFVVQWLRPNRICVSDIDVAATAEIGSGTTLLRVDYNGDISMKNQGLPTTARTPYAGYLPIKIGTAQYYLQLFQ